MRLVTAAENLSITEKEELFKIIHKAHTNYTRNNNGVFVNLAWLPLNILEDLEIYVQFCTNSQEVLCKYESLCDLLNTSLVHKKKKEDTKQAPTPTSVLNNTIDTMEVVENVVPAPNDEEERHSNSSSSMRYAIFKKRFARQAGPASHFENDLRLEAYTCV
jgi:hypothetical protein